MYHRPKKDVLTRIEKFGIKLSELSEQVIDGKKCYVIGTKVSNDKIPQIWINKETCLSNDLSKITMVLF
jgi:hypothetical protein